MYAKNYGSLSRNSTRSSPNQPADAPRNFYSFIFVISFPTLCAAGTVELPRKKSSPDVITFRSRSRRIERPRPLGCFRGRLELFGHIDW
jgi:hypothetical protein